MPAKRKSSTRGGRPAAPVSTINDLDGYEHGMADGGQLRREILGHDGLPEHALWQRLCQAITTRNAQRVGDCTRQLHELAARRARGEQLPQRDAYPLEHELIKEPTLAAAWQRYKAAVSAGDRERASAEMAAVCAMASQLVGAPCAE